MVELIIVSETLAARSRACIDELGERVTRIDPGAEVEPLGSSFWAGSLSKGDIDLLVAAPPSGFATLVEHFQRSGTEAQRENWSASFASFAIDLPSASGVGVQVFRTDADDLASIRQQTRAMAVPAFRSRYDTAKTHGQALGTRGYWMVKDAFWRTLNRSGPEWAQADRPVLKILRPAEWARLMTEGVTSGAPIDVTDGYVHLSTPEQVDETVRRHFAGAEDLWLLTLDATKLAALRWEPSRGGALFPHLYGPLQLSEVQLARPWAASDWP